jgi:hypothetical protein
MANEGKASVEIVGDVRDFARQAEKDLNDSLKKVKPNPVKVPLDTDQLKKDADDAGKSLADGVTASAHNTLKNNQSKFSQMGTSAGGAAGNAAGKSFGQQFKTLANKLGPSMSGFGKNLSAKLKPALKGAFEGALSGVSSALARAGAMAATTIGGTLAIGLAAILGPALASTLGAAITTAVGVGLGAGLIGLGAIALRESKPLKEALKGVGKTLDDVGKKAAQPLLKPLTTALRDTSELIRKLKPEFTSIFKSLAPAIKPLNESFGRFVGFLVRGIKDSMPGITAALDGFGKGLETVGKTLGDFFRDLFANDKLIDNAAEGFMNLISMGIKPLGSLISGLTVLFAAWNNVIKLTSGTFLPRILEGFRMFVDGGTGMLDRIAQAWGPLGDAIQNVWNKIKDFAGEDNEKLLEGKFMAIVQAIKETWEPLKEFFTVLWNEIVAFLRRKWEEDFMPWWEGTARPWLENAIQGAFEAAWDAAVRVVGEKLSSLTSRIGGWLSALPGRIWGWISSIPGIFASMFSSAAARALAGAMQIVNGVRARLAQLPGQIRAILGAAKNAVIGAFAGAGGWLLNAGAQIINGLVAGIQNGIGRVQSAVRALAGSIPAWANRILEVHSPSRVMERVGDYTAQGLEVGFLKRENNLRKAVEGVAGSMSSWAAPSGQRGYGATTMTGGVNFTINVSGATGESAGKRAAEQVLQQLAAAGLVR